MKTSMHLKRRAIREPGEKMQENTIFDYKETESDVEERVSLASLRQYVSMSQFHLQENLFGSRAGGYFLPSLSASFFYNHFFSSSVDI